MSFETFITCDQEDCHSRKEVPQPGELPQGWVFIQYVRGQIALVKNGPSDQKAMVRKVFCSWKCLQKEVKKYLMEKMSE